MTETEMAYLGLFTPTIKQDNPEYPALFIIWIAPFWSVIIGNIFVLYAFPQTSTQ